MTAPADQPAQPLRTWRPMALWSVGILLALALAWFVGAVVWPVYKVRKATPWGTVPVYFTFPSGQDFLEEIGVDWSSASDPYWGPSAADVNVYLRMPAAIAPEKERAVSLLATMEDGVPVLVRMLDNPRADLRMAAAYFLSQKGPRRQQAIPALLRALGDEQYVVRCFAAKALGRIGSPEAVEPLITAQHDAMMDVRSAAAEALKKIRGEEPKP